MAVEGFSQAAHLLLGSLAFNSNLDAPVEAENGAFPELPGFLNKRRQIGFVRPWRIVVFKTKICAKAAARLTEQAPRFGKKLRIRTEWQGTVICEKDRYGLL